jgi:RNA polymerase subunit RPABC4/transcription elongation factor Spt4
MSATCQGICVRHQASTRHHQSNYLYGVKRCQVCCRFMVWDGLFCPCCHMRLRTRPRSSQYKMKWHEMIIAT